MKRKISVFGAVLMALVITSVVVAQYAGYTMGTAYQLVNTSAAPVTITVEYYDASGVRQDTATRTFADVEVNGSRLVVVPKDETNLIPGSYSAVVSSGDTIAGIVNEEYYPVGGGNSVPPFASYSASGEGSTTVYVPSVMYNYYGFYTELFIQNAGSANATDVKIEYQPATLGGVVAGTAYTDFPITINQFATATKSQQSLTALGAASGTYAGMFFGSAKITSSQPLVVVVNEHNPPQKKLLSYNGFNGGATKLMSPTAMRNWWTYFTSLTIYNIDTVNPACVRLTYNPDTSAANQTYMKRVGAAAGVGPFNPVVAQFAVAPNGTLLRVESSASKNDLWAAYDVFTGAVTIESFVGTVGGTTCTTTPALVGMMNVESPAGVGLPNRAGSFNLIPVGTATNKVVAPVILANFYGLYTTTTIANTTSTLASCAITYTSAAKSAVGTGISKTYTRDLAANGTLMLYEGKPSGTTDPRSDISRDAAQWTVSGNSRFIGSASIVCTDKAVPATAIPVVVTVNEENALTGTDAMYTMNTIYK